jgi:DNA-binding NtrC family response regulator
MGQPSPGSPPTVGDLLEGRLSFYETMEKFEREIIEQTLRRVNGVQRKAAVLLGLKATTLNEKIKRLRIDPS